MDVATLVDYCIGSKGAAFDIAQVVYQILKNKYRYIGDNTWEYYDPDANAWIIDDERSRICTSIRIDVCQAFMDRALHWQYASACTDISTKIDCQLRAQKIMEICLKLKKDKFVKDVLKEARGFLSVV